MEKIDTLTEHPGFTVFLNTEPLFDMQASDTSFERFVFLVVHQYSFALRHGVRVSFTAVVH
jgi:hypothetical protein